MFLKVDPQDMKEYEICNNRVEEGTLDRKTIHKSSRRWLTIDDSDTAAELQGPLPNLMRYIRRLGEAKETLEAYEQLEEEAA